MYGRWDELNFGEVDKVFIWGLYYSYEKENDKQRLSSRAYMEREIR